MFWLAVSRLHSARRSLVSPSRLRTQCEVDHRLSDPKPGKERGKIKEEIFN